MLTSITLTDVWNVYTFHVVNNFPDDYIVWNIGREHFPIQGYIPLAKIVSDYHIDPNTLMTIKCPSAEVADIILKKAGRKTINKTEYNKIVEEYESKC